MATFTTEEIEFLKSHGNDACAKTWLGLWDPKRAVHQDQRELMIDKYERKRYFLEPASPLKSLTNAAKLTPSSSNSSASQMLSNSSSSLSGSNGNIPAANQKTNSLDNGFQNITLTPPSSRSSGNGNVSSYGPSAISRPNHQNPQQNGHHNGHYDAFSNGLNGLNGNSKTGFNGSTASSETSSCNSNGFTPESDFVADFSSANIFDATSSHSVTSSAGSGTVRTNGYATVQPFTAAQVMNGSATPLVNGTGSVKVQTVGGNAGRFTNTSNGNTENFADFDHAPIFNAAEFNNKSIKANNQRQTNNYSNNNNNNNNNTNNNSTIFRPANQPQNCTYSNSMYDIINEFNSISLLNNASAPLDGEHDNNSFSKDIFNNCSNISSMPYPHYNGSTLNSYSSSNNDFIKPLSGHQTNQQHQQKFTPLAMAAHATAMAVLGHNNSGVNNNNIFGVAKQWGNTWQQEDSSLADSQQWPGLASANNNVSLSCNHPLSISVNNNPIDPGLDISHPSSRNSWSFPMTKSSTSNGVLSNTTFNSNSSITSSPPADRYAALKDLDEQLRESKAAAAAATAVATTVVDSFGGGNNPSNANPFKATTNQSQAQIANPFQANGVATGYFGGLPQTQQMNGLANGFNTGLPVQQQAFYNYANGFGASTTNMYPSGPNGCGFSFGPVQQPIATGGGAAFNNPFAATGSLNSNNPFL